METYEENMTKFNVVNLVALDQRTISIQCSLVASECPGWTLFSYDLSRLDLMN